MKDLMIDLETMGSNYGAVITQIGACYFDRRTGVINAEFLINIDMDDSVREGFRLEPGAVKFWMEQKNRTFLNPTLWPLRQAIDQYRGFAAGADCVWSHATFDFSMLLDACHRLQIKPVNHYGRTRDIRTLMDLVKDVKSSAGLTIALKDDEEPADAHDALADCKRQVRYCVEAMRALRNV